MSRDPSDDDDALTRDSAPDLQILGDKITLQPRSYIETRPHGHGQGHGHDHEEALMKHMASFRSEPLQSVSTTPHHLTHCTVHSPSVIIGPSIISICD